jgi:hypothetical protein
MEEPEPPAAGEEPRSRDADRPHAVPFTLETLREFFAACDAVEDGVEPDWEEHLRVIRESRDPGGPAEEDR